MKTENNNGTAERLARYLSGEMSEEEARAYEEKEIVSEEDKIRIERMKRQWKAMEGYMDPETPDTRKAWNKLHERLRDEQLIPEQGVEVKKMFPLYLARIAAVAAIVLGVAVVIYFSMNRKPETQLVQINTGNEPATRIKTLADGSVVYIAQHSSFSFPGDFGSDSRNVELKGEAFFDIAPDPEKPFLISTEEVQIRVLGTAFNVKTENDHTFELLVARGKVQVTLKKDPAHPVMATSGEKISVIGHHLVKSKHLPGEADGWYKQRMHFKDEMLQNIISVLNRNFNTTFVLQDDEIGKRRMTVTFQNESPEIMTDLLCATLNLKSQQLNGAVVLSENK
ncbi:MAG TPA: FecR domain-containing protein [Bacteroidales bacterium]|nr:FecR domain-containing protein [Bacteroidales bacterium]